MNFLAPRPARPARPRGRDKAVLRVEALEERLALSWGGVPPPTIPVPTTAHALTVDPVSAYGANYTNIGGTEVDMETFVAPTTGAYRMTATGYNGLDTVLGVYNASGQRLAYNDDSGGTRNSDLTVDLTAGQRYYVGVSAYNGYTTGWYYLSVDGPNDDNYENNDTQATAYNLGSPTRPQTYTGLVMRDGWDFYRFNTQTTGTAHDYVQIDFSHAQGDLDLYLYDASGNQVRYSNGVGNSERVSLQGLGAGQYRIGVRGFAEAVNPNYSMTVGYIRDFENNNSRSLATDLGTLGSTYSIEQRMLDAGSSSGDWFRFRMNGLGRAGDQVRLDFQHAYGDLDVIVYDSNGNRLRASQGVTNTETISLQGLGAGTYFVHVYGYNNATNSQYSLSVTPGTGAATNAAKVLYVNFDGHNISRADLVRYSGAVELPIFGLIGGDWADMVNQLDSDRNGINVSAYLSGDANREAVIARIMQQLRDDLGGFGISVQRTWGGAVEGVGATTIFVGPSTLTNGYFHVAAGVDFGNNDRTSIAFVGQERAYRTSGGNYTFSSFGNTFSVEATALAMSDVILHEAGHTWGLYHVNTNVSGTVHPESMGLRYTQSNQDLWIRDTGFLDRSFNEYSTHGGGRGAQNAFRSLMVTMGMTSSMSFGAPAAAGNLAASGSRSVSAPTTNGRCGCPMCSGGSMGLIQQSIDGVFGDDGAEVAVPVVRRVPRSEVPLSLSLGGPTATLATLDVPVSVQSRTVTRQNVALTEQTTQTPEVLQTLTQPGSVRRLQRTEGGSLSEQTQQPDNLNLGE